MIKKIIGITTMIAFLFPPISAYAIDVGDKAPLFAAESTSGKVRLEDFLGKKHVILAFYYADFTPV